jgi:thiol-disulfide isomerase/thioredoxin
VIPVKRTLILLLISAAFTAGGVCPAAQNRPLPEVDAAGLEKTIAGLKGKVVFVNMWATWCPPCVAEFPDIVKLYRKYKSQGLEVIAVSFDEDASTAISFLDRHQADFINFLRSPKQDAGVFMRQMEPGFVALPGSWIFDRDGKKQFYTMGKFDPEKLEALIVTLLQGKEPVE